MVNLIEASDLHKLLETDDLRIFDLRYKLGGKEPDWGKSAYDDGHIPGSIFFDLNNDLSSKPKKHGGRHPLPDMAIFIDKLTDAGVNNKSKIVLYDDNGAAFAMRMWWMLKYIGHENVKVLNADYSAWLEAGYPISKTIKSFVKTTYKMKIQAGLLVDMDYLAKNISSSGVEIVDARAESRYLGLEEPLDPKAGHIPSALNYPYSKNLHNGKFKTKTQLKEQYKNLDKNSEIIAYCGSGVTSCHTLFVLNELAYKNLRLYIGSWSDWVSYPNNPIEGD